MQENQFCQIQQNSLLRKCREEDDKMGRHTDVILLIEI